MWVSLNNNCSFIHIQPFRSVNLPDKYLMKEGKRVNIYESSNGILLGFLFETASVAYMSY